LVRYLWPGNIREMQNVIERAVILSRGPELEIPLSQFKQWPKAALADFSSAFSTLEDAEREHILRALGETNWIIGGASGAAFKLGMKRTTLPTKKRKLGIARSHEVLPIRRLVRGPPHELFFPSLLFFV